MHTCITKSQYINQNILGKVDNTMAADALALCDFRSPKLVLLSIWDKQVLALHEEAFEFPMPFDLIVRNVGISNTICMFADEWIQIKPEELHYMCTMTR